MKTLTKLEWPVNELIRVIQNNQHSQSDVSEFYGLILPVIKLQINKHRSYLLRTDPDELAHDIFVKTFYKVGTFDPLKGNLFSWVKTIARNAITDLFRKQKVDKSLSLDKMLDNGFNCQTNEIYSSPERKLINYETSVELAGYLDKLTGINRELFLGFYDAEQSLKELASKYKISENNVSVRLFRTKQWLKSQLKAEKSRELAILNKSTGICKRNKF